MPVSKLHVMRMIRKLDEFDTYGNITFLIGHGLDILTLYTIAIFIYKISTLASNLRGKKVILVLL